MLDKIHYYSSPPLAIGVEIEGYGKIEGYRTDGSERYYFLLHEDGSVAYIPTTVIERIHKKAIGE